MRGEKPELLVLIPVLYGSPPRARGKVNGLASVEVGVGITPACAGKRACPLRLIAFARDHPRVRGEKFSFRPTGGMDMGSPPRARGKVHQCGSSKAVSGITPACAGKSPSYQSIRLLARDHPRVRGEKAGRLLNLFNHLGSPPRARGKVYGFNSSREDQRITPACAGKSVHACTWRCSPRDHPRVRGEKASFGSESQVRPGSPPRARGKVTILTVKLAPMGITPACAGKSQGAVGD